MRSFEKNVEDMFVAVVHNEETNASQLVRLPALQLKLISHAWKVRVSVDSLTSVSGCFAFEV